MKDRSKTLFFIKYMSPWKSNIFYNIVAKMEYIKLQI